MSRMRIEEINESSLAYNLSVSNEISNICTPLFDLFGVTYFVYIRLFPNGNMLRVSNQQQWSQTFFENHFYNDVEFYMRYMRGLTGKNNTKNFLWDTQSKHRLYQTLELNKISNGFSSYTRYNDYIETFSLGTSPENESIHDIFHNKIELLYHFNNYFKEQASFLLDATDESKLICTKNDFLNIEK